MNRYLLTIRVDNEDVQSTVVALSDRHALKAAIAILDASEGGCLPDDIVMISLVRLEIPNRQENTTL